MKNQKYELLKTIQKLTTYNSLAHTQILQTNFPDVLLKVN